jgi:hypothetical protein
MLAALWFCLLATTMPPAAQMPLNVVWRAPGAIEIPIGERPESQSVELPPVGAARHGVLCLRFAARLYTAEPGGWNQYLALTINGTPLGPVTPAGQWRVLNWPRLVRSTWPTEPKVATMRSRSGFDCLLVFFSPDDSAGDPRVLDNQEQGCWYLLDVSDLLRTDAPNTLKLTNTAVKAYWPGGPPADCRLIVGHLQAGYLPASQARQLRRSEWKERSQVRGPSLSEGTSAVTVAAGGGGQVAVGNELYFLESSYTCLTKPRSLLCAGGAEGWSPSVRLRANGELGLTAKCDEFRLRRTIRLNGGRVEVTDALTNTADRVIGVIIRHEIILPSGIQSFRLGGTREVALGPRTTPENPTLFAAQQNTGLGLVAEDDIMRLQMGSEMTGNRVAAYLENFGLAPGATYRLKFALYPCITDYFDFINQVRRDWNVNFTVLGPFEFVSAREYQQPADEGKLRTLLARKNIRLFALTPWFEYYDRANMTRDEFKSLLQPAIRLIKSVEPDALCLGLLETNLSPVPLAFFRDTLPQDLPFGRPGSTYPVGKVPGQYGYPAPPAATAIVNESVWRDSCLRNERGNVLLDTWYVHHYIDPPALNLMVYPADGNHRYRLGLDQLAFLLDDVGLDAVYIDQFSLAYGSTDRYTYDYWDGHTVDIDAATGEVARKCADLGWVSAGARKQWVEFALQRGKVVVANSMPAVMELQSLPIFRFMETQGYDPLAQGIPDQPGCAKGQLGSPIGLGHQWNHQGAEFYLRTVCAHLRYGLLYYYYATDFSAEDGEYGPVNHMFPFTPVALHEGWVEGKERTITCVSGAFTRPAEPEPVTHLFDSHGREKQSGVSVERSGDGYRVQVRLDDWREVAVIE